MYAFAPEKTPSLAGRNFCLAMASQKVRPAALRRFFRTSTYLMYAFAPEKTPSLAGRNFCLAIPRVFAKPSTHWERGKNHV
jgi:hypothetical protein